MKLQLGVRPRSFRVLDSPDATLTGAIRSASADISRHAAEVQDVTVTGFTEHVVRGRITVVLNDERTWKRNGAKVAPSGCAGVGIRSAIAAGLDRALGLDGSLRLGGEDDTNAKKTLLASADGSTPSGKLSVARGGSLKPVGGVVPGNGRDRVTRNPCPPRPADVVKMGNKHFSVTYDFATPPLTAAAVREAMSRLEDHTVFSLAVVGKVNFLDSRGFAPSTLALTADPDLTENGEGFPSADPLVDVLVRIPATLSPRAARTFKSPMHASDIVADCLRASIVRDAKQFKSGLATYGADAEPALARSCFEGSCMDVFPAANLPPPSPPPPARAAAAAKVELVGLTEETFKEKEMTAFIAAMAKLAGVDPAAIKIKKIAKRKKRRRRKRKVKLGRRLSQEEGGGEYGYEYDYDYEELTAEDGGGLVIDFEIETEDNLNTDQVAARIESATPANVVAILKEEPTLSNITEAVIPPGAVTLLTPPAPPAAPSKPQAPPLTFGEKCAPTTLVTAPDGVISDGTVRASPYAPDVDCTWTIAPERGPITVSFTFFDTEAGDDVVELWDGQSAETATKIGTFTGSELPGGGEPLTTLSDAAMIRFKSDSTTQGRGWALVYESANATYVPVTGSVALEGYTLATFGAPEKAGFVAVMAAAASVPVPRVFVASVEAVSSTSRRRLSAGGGVNVTYTVKAADDAAARATETAISSVSRDELYLDFKAQASLANVTGVSAVVDPVLASDQASNLGGLGSGDGKTATDSSSSPCKQTTRHHGVSGTVTDGTLAAVDYASSSRCVQVIESASAARPRVRLIFDRFDTEQFMDTLTIYDSEESWAAHEAGNDPEDVHRIGRYSGFGVPGDGVVVSPGPTMVLVFATDATVNRKGFGASWISTDEIPRRPASEAQGAPCVGGGATLTAASGTFQDSGNDANYRSDMDCHWSIKPTNVRSIRLTFAHLLLEDGFDFVYLYTKSSAAGELKPLARITGSMKPGVNAPEAGNMLALLSLHRLYYFHSIAKVNALVNMNMVRLPNRTLPSGVLRHKRRVDGGAPQDGFQDEPARVRRRVEGGDGGGDGRGEKVGPLLLGRKRKRFRDGRRLRRRGVFPLRRHVFGFDHHPLERHRA